VIVLDIFSFFTVKVTTNNGTKRLMTEGKNSLKIMPCEETNPPTHSMVVVTSPIGENALPALQAITMSATRKSLGLS